MSNATAERLLKDVSLAAHDAPGTDMYSVWQKRLDEALAAERKPLIAALRALVDRFVPDYAPSDRGPDVDAAAQARAILDAGAAR